jgi:filamentous hemagglutinin family protein
MLWRLQKLLLTLALAPLAIGSALAGPNGATVVGGAASVQGQGTASVVVNQLSQSAIINWNTFNIGAGQSTKIYMPSASSTELDRVTGGLGPSQILGSLWSNGLVFLVNPDGILFGTGAKIDVAGLLATTSNISNSDFMAGRYNFTIPGMPNASIVNGGTITAQSGGFAALVAPGVRNTGIITAKLGTIALASGNAFTLDFYGDSLITLGVNDSIAAKVLDVSTGQPLSSLVSNTGKLKANGGTVALTAAAARQVVNSVINNSGVIEANSIGTHNGKIVLSAPTAASKPAGAPTQTVTVSGKLLASGKQNGTTGGTIEVTGENIAVSGATIDASGQAGGGTVLIGGDTGGGHPSVLAAAIAGAALQPFAVPTATAVSVDANSVINASATGQGNGGKVVVWSNQATTFYGTILATGGAAGGNGGFVETSGGTVDFAGISVNASAAHGAAGTWLLDPVDLIIDATLAGEIDTTLNGGTSVALQTSQSGNPSTPYTLTAGEMNASGNGDIIVDSNVNLTWANASTLTLSAFGSIDFQSGALISNTGAGSLILRADNTGAGTGTVSFAAAGQIDFSGSTGTVSVFYNPADNPAGSAVNASSYTSPTDYTPYVLTNGAVPNQLTAYMLVNSVYDLQDVQNNPSGSYALGTNIDASATVGWNGGAGFVPIATNEQGFAGIFQGQGNTISNLTIAPTAPNMQTIGLFGTIGQGGQVSNVALDNVSITADPNFLQGTYSEFIGALAGQNGGLIENVTASGQINGGTVGGVTAGGLVGQNGLFGPFPNMLGTIRGSQAAVNITLGDGFACNSNSCNSPQNWAGGLAGFNPGSIASSSASGSVVVGSNSSAGGLVGENANFDSNNNPIAGASIVDSSASGPVSSAGTDVQIGGLVGQNNPLSLITNSQAYGLVSATGTATNNCSGDCQYIDAGGLVGQNSGTISGPSWVTALSLATAPSACSAGYACYSGTVTVGSEAQGGGLAGSNDGIISNAFAIADVVGAAGFATTLGNNDSNTKLGGLVGGNTGQIINSFASGSVGSLTTANLQVGGLVSDNSGTISGSFASAVVSAGVNSQAGGLVGGNSPNDDSSCNGCYVGDGENNNAAISNSNAYGSVTAGASSVAGGIVGIAGSNNGSVLSGGSIANANAYGAVTAGSNSIVGGLAGIAATAISNSSAQNTLVASTGSNSIVGGLVGYNAGSVTGSSSTAPVSGGADSYIGGLFGVNFGSVSNSQVDPPITGGDNSAIGGIAGLNIGSIDGTTGPVAITSGTGGFVGGVAGINGTYTNYTSIIPNSSFPTGTIANSTVSGTGFSSPVGTTTPTTPPVLPAWLDSCAAQLCTILADGIFQTTVASVVLPPVLPPPPWLPLPFPLPIVDNSPGTVTPPASPTTGQGVNTLTTGALGPAGVPQPFDAPRVFDIPPPGETRLITDEVIVQVDCSTPQGALDAVAHEMRLSIVASQCLGQSHKTVLRMHIDNGHSVADVIRALAHVQIIAVAQPNYKYQAEPDLAQHPDVASRPQEGDAAQYALAKLGLADIHQAVKGGDIKIAVIDSQVDAKHAELDGTIAEQYDAVGVAEPPDSHGTGMAGVIASHSRLMGIAPSAQLYAVHAFSHGAQTADSTSFDIVKGLDWAVVKGVRVINMSFTGPRDPSIERALQAAHDKGIVLVAAAGNYGPKSPPLYPGADPNVIAVTATDSNDKVFAGANQGSYIAVAAPGVDILVPAPEGGYQLTTGTSVASAEVSGIVALLLERNPNLTPDDVRRILTSSARHPGTEARDDVYGAGLVDPAKAIQAASEMKPIAPQSNQRPQ